MLAPAYYTEVIHTGKECKSNIIYGYRCDRVDCNEQYIGESARTFEERYKEEHLKAPSPINSHPTSTGHLATIKLNGCIA